MRDAQQSTSDGDGSGQSTGALAGVRRAGRSLREDPARHWGALVLAVLVGLGLATLHWVGLVVGGALVGLLARSLRRALVGGLGFGALVVLVWAGSFALAGTLGSVIAMGQLSALGVAIGLLAPTLGSLARGVV